MKKKLNKFLVYIFLLTSVFSAAWVYRASFYSYFFQDDWFSFRISRVRNIQDFINFFIPRSAVIYYRPMGMQIPFFIMNKLFSFNPFPYHMVILIVHSFNIILVYFLLKMITKKRIISLLISYLYATSLIHYIPFYWFATVAFVTGPMWFFLSAIFYLKFITEEKNINYSLSLLSFFFGILTNEMVMILPVILLIYLLINRKYSYIPNAVIFFVTAGIFLSLRFLIFPPPLHDSYKIGIGTHILTNFRAYIIWSFNWPEEMKAQFINFYTVNKQFISDFNFYYKSFLYSFLLNVTFAIIPFLLTARQFLEKNYKLVIFGTIWFVISLSTVITFKDHYYAYYLPIGLPALLMIWFLPVSNLIYRLKKTDIITYFIITFILVNWYFVSNVSMDFNGKVHWAPRRANISENIINSVIPNKSVILKTGKVVIKPDTENKWAMNDQDGMRAYFNNDSIITLYSNNGNN